MTNEILIREQLPEDVDSSLRPKKINEFIGQEKVIENLQVFINSAHLRKDILDHILLYGPPGLGKTTIAQIISEEMGVGFRSTTGPILSKPGDLASILTNLQTGDVLFIDEIHRLNASVEEVLYSAMEDFTLDIIIGEGPAARTLKIDLPKFTLVGATTRLGLLSNPLRDRFGINLRMVFYNDLELAKIITRGSRIIAIDIDQDGSHEIAKRSRGTPRIALRLLKRVRDFTLSFKSNKITKEIADKSLSRLEVDRNGLDSNDLRYLKFIANKYNGGPVGVETIAAALSEDRDSIEETIEPFLIQLGFLDRTPRGRMLTKLALDYIG